MKVLILMAGNSEKFINSEYGYPKNLIEIAGKPMVQRVYENLSVLKNKFNAQFVYLVSREESHAHHTKEVIRLVDSEASIAEIPSGTAGAACSALFAVDDINNDDPLVIVNGDQILNVDLENIVENFQRQDLDGGILVFESVHPRWSYVKCDKSGYVIETAEKRPISNMATAGFYYFSKGKDFVNSAMKMIQKEARVNGIFFVCPVYNEMILLHKRIGINKINEDDYISLATLQGLRDYDMKLRAEKGAS